MVDWGRWLRPGELSLAHRGMLFMDGLPDFGKHARGLLDEPLEDGVVTVARAQGPIKLPAKFTLSVR